MTVVQPYFGALHVVTDPHVHFQRAEVSEGEEELSDPEVQALLPVGSDD